MKPVKRVDVSKLTAEQRQALGQFIRDCKAAAPHMAEMQKAAYTIYQGLMRSPEWSIAEGPRDGDVKQSLWHVKPEINYVDHIEGVQ
jgi:hypothetical protein